MRKLLLEVAVIFTFVFIVLCGGAVFANDLELDYYPNMYTVIVNNEEGGILYKLDLVWNNELEIYNTAPQGTIFIVVDSVKINEKIYFAVNPLGRASWI